MPSENSALIGWFYRSCFPVGTLEFNALLYQAIKEVLGKSDIDTEAYIERNTKKLWNKFLQNLDHDSRTGRATIFEVTDRNGMKLVWLPSNSSLASSKKEMHRRVRLSTRPTILQLIDSLTEREYEAFGCVICQLIGATDTKLTPVGNERGIDFLATINMPSKCHIIGGIHRLVRIVGQVKKYESKVELKEIQRLTDTLNEIKYQSQDIQKFIPPWFRAAAGPIVGWLIAHNGVQSGAISYAKNHGILISDSIDFAEIAALSHQFDMCCSADQRTAILKTWINNILKEATKLK